jgi:hypothetical protein
MALVLALQYYKRFASKDRILVRLAVTLLMLLVTLEAIFVSHLLYTSFILDNNSPAKLGLIPLSTPGAAACVFFTAFFAEIFYATCIWSVCKVVNSRLRFMIIPIVFLALMGIASALAFTIYLAQTHTSSSTMRIPGYLSRTQACQASATALADILISVTLCIVFRRNRAEFKGSESLINKITMYAINGAIATSFSAIWTAFCINLFSGTYYFRIFLYVTPMFYVFSILSILTTRGAPVEDADPNVQFPNFWMNTAIPADHGTMLSTLHKHDEKDSTKKDSSSA